MIQIKFEKEEENKKFNNHDDIWIEWERENEKEPTLCEITDRKLYEQHIKELTTNVKGHI